MAEVVRQLPQFRGKEGPPAGRVAVLDERAWAGRILGPLQKLNQPTADIPPFLRDTLGFSVNPEQQRQAADAITRTLAVVGLSELSVEQNLETNAWGLVASRRHVVNIIEQGKRQKNGLLYRDGATVSVQEQSGIEQPDQKVPVSIALFDDRVSDPAALLGE